MASLSKSPDAGPPEPRPVQFSAAGFQARPLAQLPLLPLDALAVVTGTNSSGKSSLLPALSLLSAAVTTQTVAFANTSSKAQAR